METNNQTKVNQWKAARWGIIIFCVIHFCFEIVLDNSKSAGLMVIVNFWFSRWYIKGQIEKGKTLDNLFLMGLSVAGVVFLIRTALGVIVSLILPL
jgi:hypothetical protein